MSSRTRKSFSVRSHAVIGAWATDDRRHAESAREFLAELERVSEEVRAAWPAALDQSLQNAQSDHPALYDLIRKRDRLCDSVRIFAAMAVEGFLNYYGVVRLGEDEFNSHFERMGLVPKLRALLLVCDGLSVSANDPLVQLLVQVANGRNALVHPKAEEVPTNPPSAQRPGIPIPEGARSAVNAMEQFFHQFVLLIPASAHLVPQKPSVA